MRYVLGAWILAVGVVAPALLWAEDSKEPSLLEEAPKDLFENGDNQFFTMSIENDSWHSGDRHYTNGLRFSYMDLRDKPPHFVDTLDKWLPFFEVNEHTGVVYSVGQNMYTPSNISNPAEQLNDRPWAGFLYGSVGLNTVEGRHVDELEATLGVVGPWSLAEQTQKVWHAVVDAPHPRGWQHQLDNEPGVMLAYNRRWPEFVKLESWDWYFAGEPNVGATVGNVYTYATTGFNVRFGPADGRWSDTPMRVRPAMPGTGFFAKPDDNSFMSWHLFGGVDTRYMVRNIFLDGNTFDSDPHVDKRNVVTDFNAGVAVSLGKVNLSYTNIYRTKEFKGQQKGDIFGGLNLGYRF
ncbi:MAG: DUF2219 family protein [Proteobacteria bacterium]|nr:DUF2219 family protein [Pseudomonadota bacterium]